MPPKQSRKGFRWVREGRDPLSCEVGKSRQQAWFPSEGDSFSRVCPVAPHPPLCALGESSVVGASLPQLQVGSCSSPSPENGSPRLPRDGTSSAL